MLKRLFYVWFVFFFLVSCHYSTEPLAKLDKMYIYFSLPEESFVQVSAQNIHGDLIKVILTKQMQPGWYKISWDGKNEKGEYVEEGFYFISIYVEAIQKTYSQLFYFGRN